MEKKCNLLKTVNGLLYKIENVDNTLQGNVEKRLKLQMHQY